MATFSELVPDGEEMVFDLNVPGLHAFVANGLVVHNCGEQPLPGWGVCNLGHINLSRFVKDGEVAWDDLKKAVRLGVRFLDNVIDVTPYFFERNEAVQKAERRVGLGTMGLGEMLIRLGLRYGSDESIEFIDNLYRVIATEAYLASIDLAKEKGPFPKFDAEKFLQSKFVQGMPQEVKDGIKKHGIRNVCILTQAPTGSTGTMVGTSTGIEPYYSWTYWRSGRLGMKEVKESIVQEWFDAHPEVEPKLENLPDYFVTAMELTPKEHIRVQAAVQRWTDSSISKTANCPNEYTVEQTKELYEYAYRLGCKGVTIYRDGSRDQQVLKVKEEDNGSGVDNGAAKTAINGAAGTTAETAQRMSAGSETAESEVALDSGQASSAYDGHRLIGRSDSLAASPAKADGGDLRVAHATWQGVYHRQRARRQASRGLCQHRQGGQRRGRGIGGPGTPRHALPQARRHPRYRAQGGLPRRPPQQHRRLDLSRLWRKPGLLGARRDRQDAA